MLKLFLVIIEVVLVQFDSVDSAGPGQCQYQTRSMENRYFYADYRGCVNTGPNGEECANWFELNFWGDDDFIDMKQAHENGVGDHNYCRNPANKRTGPWCYQKYNHNGMTKMFCDVDESNCFSDRNYDKTCPDRKAPQPGPAPQRYRLDVNEGHELVLWCNSEFPEDTVLWKSGPGLTSSTIRDNPIRVDHVTQKYAGEWECSCGGKDYAWTVNVCRVHRTDCLDTSDGWVQHATGCTNDVITTIPCNGPVDRPTRQSPDSNAAARKEAGAAEQSPGFCSQFPGVCGVVGLLGSAMVLLGGLFLYKTQKWRRWKQDQTATTLPPYNPQQLTYETTLKLQQMIADSRSTTLTSTLNNLNSRSTTLTNTLNLRNLRAEDNIGRIVSHELGSQDEIECEGYDSDEDEFISHFGDTLPNPGFLQDLEQDRRDNTIFDKYYDQNVDSWSVGSVTQI